MSDRTSVKKPNIFVRIGRKIKEVFSELRKVTWPTIGKTVKQTGVVLVVVLFFLVIITGVSFGLSVLYDLVFPGVG